MIRKAAIVAAAVALLSGALALSVPALVQRYGQHKIDEALGKIGFETTAMVRRGAVTVDVWSWTVSARSIEIAGAGAQSTVSIGKLTIARPNEAGEQLNADKVVVDELKVSAPGETISIPRAEIRGYAGPRQGLTATPGLGRDPVTQPELMGRVSIARVVAPVVIFSADRNRVRRTVRNVVIADVRDGVIGTLTADAVTIQAPFLEPGAPAAVSSLFLEGKSLRYEDLSVPVLLRFLGGDGGGPRERLVSSASIADIKATLTTRRGGRTSATIGEIRADDVDVKALTFKLSAFDPIATPLRFGEDATPQEVRDQLAFMVDLSRSVSFARLRVTGASAETERAGETWRKMSVASAEIDGYADARIETIKVENALYDRRDVLRAALASGEIAGFDATGLAAHAGKVSRDEVLLTTAPTPEEIVRIAPRIARVEAGGVDVWSPDGSLKADRASVEVDAPLDAIPQHLAVRLDGVDASPPSGTAAQRWVEAMELEGVKGSAKFSLTFDPNEKSLSLDFLDYAIAHLGEMHASGKLEAVSPLLAVATGAVFVEKFSAIRLAPIRITLKDDGATDVLLRRAAAKAGQTPEEFREAFAREVQETLMRVLGPPGENSAESAAEFIRDPRTAEITISPRNLDKPLLELIQAFDLGPAGLSQVVDLAVLYKR